MFLLPPDCTGHTWERDGAHWCPGKVPSDSPCQGLRDRGQTSISERVQGRSNISRTEGMGVVRVIVKVCYTIKMFMKLWGPQKGRGPDPSPVSNFGSAPQRGALDGGPDLTCRS